MIENESNEEIKPIIEKTPLNYGKKLYIGEFLIENFIRIVAFVSIAAIFAIFYYVFQEAGYTFAQHGFEVPAAKTVAISKEKSDKNLSSNNQNDENLKPQSYGSEPENLKQETYGSDNNDLKPETYGSTSSTESELKPESYGSATNNESELKPESYGSDNEISKPKASDSETKKEETQIPEPAKEISTQQAPVSSEISGENKAITLGSLFTPNDVIDGKKEYIWQPVGDSPKYSLIPLFVGALKVTVIALVISAPIAILAALFTVSFAPRGIREFMKPIIEILAGFPSVVIGFFCLITLSTIIQNVFHTTYRLNSFVGGVGMALAVIPIIYTVAEDALSSVPKHLKEAGLAMGASRWQTAFKIMLPAATPGVFAAIILGIGRAFGETMIALMATGNASLVSADLFESVRTMAATIGAEMAEVEFRSGHYGVLFLIGAILFVVTFCLNAVAEFYVRKKLLKKFQGL